MSRFISSYRKNGEIFELIIRDLSGAKIDSFKCDKENFGKIISIVKRKYGIVSFDKNRDLKWLKDNQDF